MSEVRQIVTGSDMAGGAESAPGLRRPPGGRDHCERDAAAKATRAEQRVKAQGAADP